jgi:hypothetical protein
MQRGSQGDDGHIRNNTTQAEIWDSRKPRRNKAKVNGGTVVYLRISEPFVEPSQISRRRDVCPRQWKSDLELAQAGLTAMSIRDESPYGH